MINNDYEGVFYYADMMGNVKKEPLVNELPQLVFEKMKYRIKDIHVVADKGYAFADVSFSVINLVDLVAENGENATLDDVKNDIRSDNFTRKDYDVQVVMLKYNGKWYLYETPDLTSALTGGLSLVDYEIRNAFYEYYGGNE